jgi:hypothetical protein
MAVPTGRAMPQIGPDALVATPHVQLFDRGCASTAQMACTHAAAMAVLAKLDVAFATERRVAAFGSAAARLLRAYAMQVEVLRRLRNGGQQFVRVEHVHVNDGGQAVIGNVKEDAKI